jgi:hypothetical protein
MSYSGETKREYQRQWMANRRREWFKDKKCVECGSKENLELHHVNPEQKWKHNFWSYSWIKILEEIKKCIVLCEKCHKLETIKKLQRPLIHGTQAGYVKGCRCKECSVAHNISTRDWKRHKRKIKGEMAEWPNAAVC